jgi:predicted RNA-binding Zn-ribbon protein involved in translation (DUF1610 family)
VPRDKIRRLYENDARGITDEVLIDDVGIGLFLRCKSMLAVEEAVHRGRIACPGCGRANVYDPGRFRDPATVLACEPCGWRLTWGEYHATFRHQELYGAGHNPFIAEYVAAWPAARTARERLLLIDRLIHLWHWEEVRRQSFGLGRPTGLNLIEGNRAQVIEFLDTLTYGERTTPELRERLARWRAGRDEVRAKQAEWRASRRREGGGADH